MSNFFNLLLNSVSSSLAMIATITLLIVLTVGLFILSQMYRKNIEQQRQEISSLERKLCSLIESTLNVPKPKPLCIQTKPSEIEKVIEEAIPLYYNGTGNKKVKLPLSSYGKEAILKSISKKVTSFIELKNKELYTEISI